MKTLKLLLLFLLVSHNVEAQCWLEVAAGYHHAIGIKTDGTLWAWGRNDYGQLGDGTNIHKTVATQIGTDTDWKLIAAGNNHSLAIKNNGTLWAWGRNNFGQLGDGSIVDKNAPFLVNNDTDWKTIASNVETSIALKEDGTFWGWGKNNANQLGDSNYLPIYLPTQIGTDANWNTVASGGGNTLTLKDDNTFWGLGAGAEGIFGNGNGDIGLNYTIPTQTLPDTDWEKISTSDLVTLAIKSDGSLWAWGKNDDGNVGNGTFINGDSSWIPNHIGTANNWTSVCTRRKLSMAVNSNGELFCWGWNFYGQLGDGTTISRNVPTAVGIGTNWKSVAIGLYFTVGLTSNGSLWAWGFNDYGQLGDGTFTNKTTPTQIGATCTLTANSFDNKNSLKAFPNPADNQLKLEYYLSESTLVQTTITNHLGQIFYSEQTNKNSGKQSEPLNLSSYPTGIYLISVYTDNLHNTIKIIKN